MCYGNNLKPEVTVAAYNYFPHPKSLSIPSECLGILDFFSVSASASVSYSNSTERSAMHHLARKHPNDLCVSFVIGSL